MDFILGTDYIVMVHDNKLNPVVRLFRTEERTLNATSAQNSLLAKPPAFVMHKILEELFLYIYPIIDHITGEIDEIEKSIFQGKYRQMVDEILMTKRKIVNLRRIMQSHKNIIRKLIDKDLAIQKNSEVKVYFEDLIDRAKEIWQILESQNEHINALHATNESLISFRLNDIMKTLTIFSVVVFPLTLIAAIFGMNTQTMPLMNNKHGFWFIIGAMSFGTLCMFLFFKKKKWL
jgi:magnesium transporter